MTPKQIFRSLAFGFVAAVLCGLAIDYLEVPQWTILIAGPLVGGVAAVLAG